MDTIHRGERGENGRDQAGDKLSTGQEGWAEENTNVGLIKTIAQNMSTFESRKYKSRGYTFLGKAIYRGNSTTVN